MHRRSFFKTLRLVALGLSLPSLTLTTCSTNPQPAPDARDRTVTPENRKRIVVIGAGLAGLAAAHKLHAQGHDVTLVEARDRIGGRIWTSRQWPDIPLDLGATWIHGTQGNPLTILADTIQAQRIVTSYDRSEIYNTSGQPLSPAETGRLERLRTQVFRTLEQAQDQDNDASLRQVLEPLTRSLEPSSEAYRFINFILSGNIEQEYAGAAEHLSVHWYDSARSFQGDDVFFSQGFQVIADYLAHQIPIELGQIVQEIEWDRPSVRIMTQTREFVADYAVVTLPLGVLQARRVKFTPDLPASKQNAIQTLGMGVLNKCYLRFQDAFWPEDADWLEYISANHGEWTEWVSFKRVANQPILLGFNAATRGRDIEAWSDQKIVASAMHTLKTIYGESIPEPIDYQITRWATDPFALGSYSYHPVGSMPTMRQELAKPLENRVFFAGEATEQTYFATTHGAYLSGLRAAKAILEL